MTTTPTLYILELTDNKFYVGKTDRPIEDRILEHFENNGAEWTKKYRPIKLVETVTNVDNFDEDKYTKIFMLKFGIQNVRGGSYVTIDLPEYQLQALNKELDTSQNKCYQCHQSGHYIKNCYTNSQIGDCSELIKDNNLDTNNLTNDTRQPDPNPIQVLPPSIKFRNKRVCFRCGRNNHWIKNCYAKTHISGYKLFK